MQIKHFFDPATWTLTYLVWDEGTGDAVVIDPVWDYNPLSVSFSTQSLDEVLAFAKKKGLKIHYSLETHAHADHISAGALLRDQVGAKVGIGEAILAVQGLFKGVFNLGDEFKPDGSQFDALMKDGEVLSAGALNIKVLSTPGHTPACVSFQIEDALFVGDLLFMPDSGSGRCDFPAGSANDMYDSVAEKVYTLPDSTRLFVGHDYQPGGREVLCETTVGASKAANTMIPGDISREDFVSRRETRDATLKPPKLIFQSVQLNIRAGKLPPAEDNGRGYIKLPIGLFD